MVKYGKHLLDIATDKTAKPSCITLVAAELYDGRGFRERLQGPGNLTEALEIDKDEDGLPLRVASFWIGGKPVSENQILRRRLSTVPRNCKGFFYTR